MKPKRGDIILNKWAGENNPIRHFIYTHTSGKYAYGIYLHGNRLSKGMYEKNFLEKKLPDGTAAYEVVGYSGAFDRMKNDIREVQI